MKLYIALAVAIGSMKRCIDAGNQEWADNHANAILTLCEALPHGSGIDNGCQLDPESTGERLVFNVAYHHMNEAGYYDGWTEHRVIVTPSFELGYRMRITGSDRNDIKDYLRDVIGYALNSNVAEHAGYEALAKAS